MKSPEGFRFFEKPIDPGTEFRNIYILESRANLRDAGSAYDPATDLVLTYDFGLLRDVAALGGTVRYVDHLCAQEVMQENNFISYTFFRNWHYDSEGNDIFRHLEVNFGLGFRIDIWNDFTFYIRNRLCLEQLRTVSYSKIFLCRGLDRIEEILNDMNIQYHLVGITTSSGCGKYYFPIHQWMNERKSSRGIRKAFRNIVIKTHSVITSGYDFLIDHLYPKNRIFIQEYHPTRKILQALQKRVDIKVIQAHFSMRPGAEKFFYDRLIPVCGRIKKQHLKSEKLLNEFRLKKSARLILSSELDITDAAYRIIERKIAAILPERIRDLECVIKYLNRHPIQLEILIGNIGHLAMLVDSVCKSRDIPSYMIINGFLTHSYEDDGKYASVINSYSQSMRDNYFKEMDNIVCLGDPRMDDYAQTSARVINRRRPTITIGASGFSPIDLNSFAAIEFEFLHEVMTAISNVDPKGEIFQVIIKVRPNGYDFQYKKFINEFFAGRVHRIENQQPIRKVLDETDLYISIASQTLFEASCMGIPCIYHKNDCETLDTPFDGFSELVTTHDIKTLEKAILDFLSDNERYKLFMNKHVMEKYIGPLDGNNLKRNIQLINSLLNLQG